ncbi:fibrous sheath-interacting protein 1 isoform X2 [Hypomesus transpacificus]|uniref:fibrous sheath-interacting protein 1 isoform X2 n=1 Tax=Hypomesus transpacificus TaxID=137520 RepID=UPI001F07F494|nr:fibrous sheath-interacting protein 1 isoform X2 [Hypomesus transpacificus]
MDITKGNLDDISRPASSERSRPGSRVSSVSLSEVVRVCPRSPMSLVVLSSDSPDASIEDRSTSSDENENFHVGSNSFEKDMFEDEREDLEIQKAISKMKRLDKVLALRISNEKRVKRRSEELHHTLWQELQIKPIRSSESADEAQNTRMFLSLTPTHGHESTEKDHFVPVFGTQVPEQNYEDATTHMEGSEEEGSNTRSPEGGEEEGSNTRSPGGGEEEGSNTRSPGGGEEEGSVFGVLRSNKKQDFVKKNIKLVSSAGALVAMTQQEKTRLAELLKDIQEEEEGAGPAAWEGEGWVLRVPCGQGYTPEPALLDQLLHLDARLQLLLPVEGFLSVRSPYPEHNLPQVQQASWESRGSRPGDKVLQDSRESRDQERRLEQIQQQLENLGQGQERTSEPPGLVEEQLRTLLEECVQAQSRSCTLGSGCRTGDTTPGDSSNADRLLGSQTQLSDTLLSQLLRDAYTTSFSQLESGTTTS